MEDKTITWTVCGGESVFTTQDHEFSPLKAFKSPEKLLTYHIRMMNYPVKADGFTLTELLLALTILAVIATFSIPKILSTQNDARYVSIGKEFAGAVSEAYILYKRDHTLNADTGPADLTPYLNYVKVVTNSQVDDEVGQGTKNCATNRVCYLLANGGIFYFISDTKFNGTSNLNALMLEFDPDGLPNSSIEGADFHLYYNGKIRTRGNIDSGTLGYWSGSSQSTNPNTSRDPSWIVWNN